jgi:nitrite reductase/ring-hydroxylating ferredoxin subunit
MARPSHGKKRPRERTHGKKRPRERWHDVGEAAELARTPLQQIQVHGTRMALSCVGGVFGAIDGTCNHAGGPLGQGTLEGDYVVCPWHQWRFHRREGHGERGFERDVVPAYGVRVRGGRLEVSVTPRVKRQRAQHTPHPLAREPQREAGPVRVVGISTTVMNAAYPRYSTSDELLEVALARARELGCASCRSATARVTTRNRRAPAPGRARSRRWIRTTSSTASTRRSCTGPMSS